MLNNAFKCKIYQLITCRCILYCSFKVCPIGIHKLHSIPLYEHALIPQLPFYVHTTFGCTPFNMSTERTHTSEPPLWEILISEVSFTINFFFFFFFRTKAYVQRISTTNIQIHNSHDCYKNLFCTENAAKLHRKFIFWYFAFILLIPLLIFFTVCADFYEKFDIENGRMKHILLLLLAQKEMKLHELPFSFRIISISQQRWLYYILDGLRNCIGCHGNLLLCCQLVWQYFLSFPLISTRCIKNDRVRRFDLYYISNKRVLGALSLHFNTRKKIVQVRLGGE